jgi:YesN/AraC family two-component response regulator
MTFGTTTALNNVSFTLESGKIVGLLGPNGSGKTTLIKLINGLLTPNCGNILIEGELPGPATKSKVAYLPDNIYLNTWMTVQQIVKATPSLDAKDVATRLSDQHDIMAASSRTDSYRQTAVALLQQAVRLRQENVSGMKYSHVISRAEKYVAENFCDPNISLISVSKYVGLSAAHFSTVFSQTVGRSFINYLTAMRIERAKELLASTSMKLATIAMEIGYNEPNYFSHVFRKLEGITPKEYRNRTQGDQ